MPLAVYLFKIKAFGRPVIVFTHRVWHKLWHLAVNTDTFLKRIRNFPNYAKRFKNYYCISELPKDQVANFYLYSSYAKFLKLIQNNFMVAYLKGSESNLDQG